MDHNIPKIIEIINAEEETNVKKEASIKNVLKLMKKW
jgi:hypothetical protein